MIEFEIEEVDGRRWRWSSDRQAIVVGRAEACDLTLESDVASRRHLQLEQHGRIVRLSDLGSANGTFVNGQRIEGTVSIRAGDEISVGFSGPRLRLTAVDGVAQGTPSSPNGETRMEFSTAPALSGRGVGSRVALGHGVPAQTQHNSPLAGWIFLCVGVGSAMLVALFVGVWYTLPRDSSGPDGNGGVTAEKRQLGNAVSDTLSHPPRLAGGPASATAAPPTSQGNERDKASRQVEQAVPPVWSFSEEAIVWIGWQAEGFRVPICTAWAIRPDRVVLTAQMAHYLERQRESDERIELVVYDASRGDVIALQDIMLHPRFDPEDPGSQVSMHYNVGLGTLATPLHASLELLPQNDAVDALRQGQPIRIAGYAITRELQQKPFDPLSPPLLVTLDGKIAGGDISDSDIQFPRRVLDVPNTPGLVGSPIFGPNGGVVGIVHQARQRTYGIVAPVIAEMLNR